MKTHLLCLIFSLIPLISSPTLASPLLPLPYEGSMTPYPESAIDAPLPEYGDSLRPVYAQYVARHGARYLSGPGKVKSVKRLIVQAAEAGALTPLGLRFQRYLDTVISVNEGHWGELSAVGVAEQKALGKRLNRILPFLREHRPTLIRSEASFVPRAIMTMDQFNHQLALLNDSLHIFTASGPQNSLLLYFFAADSAYDAYRSKKHGPWRRDYDEYVAANVSPEPIRRLIGPGLVSDREAQDLTMDLYGIVQSDRAYGLPGTGTAYLTPEEWLQCEQASTLIHYLRNTITPLSDVAGRAASPLLSRLICQADSALTKGSPGVDSYFGHAETLLPLLSLMGIVGLPAPHESRFPQSVADIVPLGANILILYLRSDTGRHYTLIQLNGRTVTPLTPWARQKYDWLRRISRCR